jgi:preprotein translocase subunit YajC
VLTFLLFLVALVALWVVVTRPTRRQQRMMNELQAEIQIGDEVILSAGIFGTVRSVDDDRVGLEIAEDTVIMVARQAVVRRMPDAVDVTAEPPADENTED